MKRKLNRLTFEFYGHKAKMYFCNKMKIKSDRCIGLQGVLLKEMVIIVK